MQQTLLHLRVKPGSLAESAVQHRLLLLRLLAPFLFFLTTAALIVISIIFFFISDDAARNGLFLTGTMLALVLGTLIFLQQLIARRQMINVLWLMPGTCIVGISIIALIWLTTPPFGFVGMLALVTFPVAIIIAGLLLETRGLVLTAVLANAMTLGITVLTFLQSTMNTSLVSIGLLLLAFEWIFAAFMMLVQRGFQQLLQELATAYKNSEQLDSLKDAFISSVNHEIRTPLMSMVMYMDTLKQQFRHMSQEQLQFGLTNASNIGQALSTLVKSILSTRQIENEATDLSFEFIPLFTFVSQTLALLDPSEGGAAVRDLRLKISPMVVVWGDRVKLQQVMINLLSNALKYSAPGTPIEIKASHTTIDVPVTTANKRHTKTTQEMVEIAFSDHGHGMPSEQIPLLFQKFVRLPRDLASNVMGNGLGLYLCRILIEAMGGSIWGESLGEGHGSTFFIRLPVPPPEFENLRNVSSHQRTAV